MTLANVYWHPTDLFGTVLRLPSHRAVRWLVNPDHEAGRWQTLRLLVPPDGVVYDIGAEQGDLSALLAAWVPDGGVVLIEPNPAAWSTIDVTFAENDLTDRIIGRYRCLLDATSEQLVDEWPASDDPLDPAAGMVNLAEQAADHQTTTLDHLVAQTGRVPSVLNIDVEGAEYEVLQGAKRTLEEHRPIVAVSVHPEFLAHWWNRTVQDVLGLLHFYGYQTNLVHADHELHYVCLPG